LQWRWFVRLRVNEVHAPGNIDTQSLLLGAGLRLEDSTQQGGGAGPIFSPQRHRTYDDREAPLVSGAVSLTAVCT
jgi:hypothetical protein